MISIIVAYDMQRGIGYKNQIPWHIKEDLRFFKNTTSYNSIIMGYNTWLSLGCKPLKNRYNVILSKRHKQEIVSDKYKDSIAVEDSIDSAIIKAYGRYENIYIIGGQQIYQQFLTNNLVDRIIATEIKNSFSPIDSYFPNIDYANWTKVNLSQSSLYDIVEYIRVKNANQ